MIENQREIRIKEARSLSENYGRLQEVREKLVELYNEKDNENVKGEIFKLMDCLIEIVDVLKALELELIVHEKDIEVLLKS
jgi:hypothetical protein